MHSEEAPSDSPLFPVLWLTGNAGAGKTTLAEGLERYVNHELDPAHAIARRLIVLDGDAMRETISQGLGFGVEDRREHNVRVARLAAHLRERGFLVAVSVIAPFAAVRAEIDAVCAPAWIHVRRSGLDAADRPYEPPTDAVLTIDHDLLGIADAQSVLRSFVRGRLIKPFTRPPSAAPRSRAPRSARL